jgi:Arc/MetJ-type ribon-helix-helix transcriptional regulator
MELDLPPELEREILRKLESGRYGSARDIIIRALTSYIRIDDQRDQALAALRKMVALGEEGDGNEARDFLLSQGREWEQARH